jgi:hypothetical protein
VGDFTRRNIYYASLKFTQRAKRKEITKEAARDPVPLMGMHTPRVGPLQFFPKRTQKPAKNCGDASGKKNVTANEIADEMIG